VYVSIGWLIALIDGSDLPPGLEIEIYYFFSPQMRESPYGKLRLKKGSEFRGMIFELIYG